MEKIYKQYNHLKIMQFLKRESAYQRRSPFLQISDSENKLNCLGFMNQGHINLVKYKNRIISNE